MGILKQFFNKISNTIFTRYPESTPDQDIIVFSTPQSYDEIITTHLKTNTIPTPENNYILGQNIDKLEGKDKETFQSLYSLIPPRKKSSNNIGSKGSGYGEIAMYWLLKKNYNIKDGRNGGKPDLIIDNTIGIEIKSFDTKKIPLGRFGSDKENLELLNTLFGIHSLITKPENKTSGKKINSSNFSSKDLIKSFESLNEFLINTETYPLNNPLFENIYSNIDSLLSNLDISPTNINPQQASAEILRRILYNKLNTKPGFGGYIVNTDFSGKIEYHSITQDKIKQIPDNILNTYVSSNQSTLIIYPDQLF
jgi:hypothetical protein